MVHLGRIDRRLDFYGRAGAIHCEECAGAGVSVANHRAIETRTIPRTLQTIDLITEEQDLMKMFCEMIVKNKSISIYDGAYKCVELATGKKFARESLIGSG